jgi:hypothetical protein
MQEAIMVAAAMAGVDRGVVAIASIGEEVMEAAMGFGGRLWR